jgi:hypothetical protein
MPCFRKLSFPSADIADQILASLDASDNIVVIGYLCEEKDQEGVCVKLRKDFAVDVLFNADTPSEVVEPYIVWPKNCGVHSFLGWDEKYEQDRLQANESKEVSE